MSAPDPRRPARAAGGSPRLIPLFLATVVVGACAAGSGTSKSPSAERSAATPVATPAARADEAVAPSPSAAAPESTVADGAALLPEPGWPRWLETAGGLATDQTSGLTFLGRDPAGAKVFLVADDVGALWRMSLSGAADELGLVGIPFEGAARETLAPFPKKDIEEISYCPITHRVLISLEGNTPKDSTRSEDFRRWVGVFEVSLEPNPFEARRATRLARVAVPEWDSASRLASPNIGFEGMVLYGDTLLLGLEGISAGQNIFADSTVIEVFDLARGTGLEVGTKPLGIVTITGLSASPEHRFYGVDRNAARVFSFRLRAGAVVDFRSAPISMPGVRGVPYFLPSAESIAVDDEGFIWIAVDPWRYRPLSREGLTPHDLANYAKQVPLLYKYRDPFGDPRTGSGGGR